MSYQNARKNAVIRAIFAILAVVGVDKLLDLSGMINLPVSLSNILSVAVLGLIILSLLKFSLFKKRDVKWKK